MNFSIGEQMYARRMLGLSNRDGRDFSDKDCLRLMRLEGWTKDQFWDAYVRFVEGGFGVRG